MNCDRLVAVRLWLERQVQFCSLTDADAARARICLAHGICLVAPALQVGLNIVSADDACHGKLVSLSFRWSAPQLELHIDGCPLQRPRHLHGGEIVRVPLWRGGSGAVIIIARGPTRCRGLALHLAVAHNLAEQICALLLAVGAL